MSNGAAVSQFLDKIVAMMRGITVPGFDFSVYALHFGVFLIGLSIFMIRHFFRLESPPEGRPKSSKSNKEA